MKIVFIYEHFTPPFDEGIKNFAYRVHRELSRSHMVRVMRYLRHMPHFLNALLMVPRIVVQSMWFRAEKIIFIPQAALTFSSLVKISMLQSLFPGKVTVVGVQKRILAPWQEKIVARVKLRDILVLSSAMAKSLQDLGIDSTILNLGVDLGQYKPVSNKQALREKYAIPADQLVVLHVGHIKRSRNIAWLAEVQRALPGTQVVLVGSTTTGRDIDLGAQLEQAGVIVLREYLQDIHELYQLADVYCFTVMSDAGAMETPLSILESMATNLPVVTTRFGRLPEQFSQDEYYRYVNSADEMIAVLRTGFGDECNNRQKMNEYSWAATAQRLMAA
ncbi:MAG: glycosyltransferase [Gammaproteobacteria bacterium]|nr:glycosyltransferase [Gammaproteobacteria bacterium]MDH3768254.1 glycosyltransferase [Gammaproteobacteria bacterium]